MNDSELLEKLFTTDGDLVKSTGEYERLERMVHAIRAELITHHRRENPEKGAWFTVELIVKIISGDYFGGKKDEEFLKSLRSEAPK